MTSPCILALQPRPVSVRVLPFRTRAGQVVTAIARSWRPGDSGPAGRCRLCASCAAEDDVCLIQVGRPVSHEEAALFSTVGMRCQGDGSDLMRRLP